jgi:hypothetical protein
VGNDVVMLSSFVESRSKRHDGARWRRMLPSGESGTRKGCLFVPDGHRRSKISYN